jgi:dTDP-4-amino-4,6-dideoxygalactose transaminase
MPALSDFTRYLEQIWERRWLTNNGLLHQEFEARLAEHLGVEQISLFCNGTIALLVAIQALAIRGEVITTPFTFPATVHVLHWNRIRPVFCDIEETTFNIDPALIEARIGPRTTAILPVHVFGTPCDVRAIDAIASRRKLKVIYDAAHAFGVRYMGRSLASYGHLAVLSFHATKLFSTIEGGAIVSRTKTDKRRVDFLKNFGFADEETIIGPGINGKMNELQAAYGLLQLKQVDQEIARRLALTEQYRSLLRHVRGVRVLPDTPDTTRNGAYFPILIDRDEYGRTRDELYSEMKRYGIHPRKYFHPLLSSVACYRSSPGAGAKQLPVARRVAQRVLCLPIYGTLRRDTVSTICDLIAAYGRP